MVFAPPNKLFQIPQDREEHWIDVGVDQLGKRSQAGRNNDGNDLRDRSLDPREMVLQALHDDVGQRANKGDMKFNGISNMMCSFIGSR